MTGFSFDKEKISINLARLKKDSHIFEVVIDSDAAVAFKEGKTVEIRDILKAEKVFSDAHKGLVASEHVMKEVFNSADPLVVAEKIIREGEIQLTAEHRQLVRERKKKQIIDKIHMYGVDPRTHAPHPITRIEAAFEEGKVKIDEFKNADEQVAIIIKQLAPILPIRFEQKEIALKFSAEYAGKAAPVVHRLAKVIKQDWQSDGSWVCVVEIPAGLETELYDKLNSLTHGKLEAKVLKTK
jgi:ribosome maturation protein SDO1